MAIKASNQITFIEQKKIVEIKEWYLVSDQDSGITVDTEGWDTKMQSFSEDKPYLWNYEEVTYSLGSPDKSDPIIIGTYIKGDEGKGISDIKNYYVITSVPELPIEPEWSDDVTTTLGLSPENKYLWNYEEFIYTDGPPKKTDAAIIGVYGDSGTDAVDFQIYSTDGLEFYGDVDTIVLKTVAFQGGKLIEDSNPDDNIENPSYQWYWWNKDGEKYSLIDEATSSELTVKKTDTYAFTSLKCIMIYDELTYEDHVSLTEKTSTYSAKVGFFDGDNMFAAGEAYTVMYIDLYKNGTIEESPAAAKYRYIGDTLIQNVKNEEGEEFVDEEYIYFIHTNGTNSKYTATLAQYHKDTNSWSEVNLTNNYIYYNDIYPDVHSNVIAISKDDVLRSRIINTEVYYDENSSDEDRGVLVAVTSATIIDVNEPIVGDDEPANPKVGQLWLKTSAIPHILYVYNSDGKWVPSNYQDGGKVHTKKPDPGEYKAGDLWILADGEEYVYTSTDGQKTIFGPGSILRADENLNWYDAITNVTTTITNVRESFTWDDEGIKIAKKVTGEDGNITTPFYVKIDSTEMGFYDNDKKVVHISNDSAMIKNAIFTSDDIDNNNTGESAPIAEFVNSSATFYKPVTFQQQINMTTQDSSSGFIWKVEENGSLSLAII